MKVERIDMDKIRSDIGNAFLLAKRFYERREDTKGLVWLAGAENRVAAFLCGVDANNARHKAAEAREALLMEALRACQVCAESKNHRETERARALSRAVIGHYGEPGGMYAN